MIICGNKNMEIPNYSHFGRYMLSNLRKAKGNAVCLENGVTREALTYEQATQYSVNLSTSLSKLGVKRGDVVALGSEDFLYFVPTVLAVTFTGAAYTAYELTIGKAVLRHKLQLVKPKYFISSTSFWTAYKDVLQTFSCIEVHIAITNNPDIPHSIESLTKGVNVDIDTFEPEAVEGKTDAAIILYSSGTTGMPKGVEITHYSCILTCLPDADRSSLQTAYMWGQWHINLFIHMTYKFLVLGRKVVFSHNKSIKTFLPILKNCKVDVMFGGSAFIHRLAISDLPVEDYFDTVKMIYCRSSPLREYTIKLLKKRFPKVKDVIQAFGLTECGEPISEIWATKHKPGSTGVVSPDVKVKIVDPNTREILGPNQQGEICVKGSMIMKGYLDIDPFDYLDEDGYYKTGDLGYFDEDQYFYIVDRLTDIIHTSGMKVSPVEVENVLLKYDGVLDAGVVGKPDPIHAEVPMAFVVKKQEKDISEKDLVEFVASEVSPLMQLQGGVIFIPELPRNPRGKILRRKLKEMLNDYK